MYSYMLVYESKTRMYRSFTEIPLPLSKSLVLKLEENMRQQTGEPDTMLVNAVLLASEGGDSQ